MRFCAAPVTVLLAVLCQKWLLAGLLTVVVAKVADFGHVNQRILSKNVERRHTPPIPIDLLLFMAILRAAYPAARLVTHQFVSQTNNHSHVAHATRRGISFKQSLGEFKENPMFGMRFVKGAAVSLAILGMMMPQGRLLADAPQSNPPIEKNSKVARVPDVVLTEGGTLSGRVVDHAGKVIEGANVELKQNNKVVSTTKTDKEGLYSFKNLKAGVYNPSSGNTEGVFRVWPQKSAPPSAKEHALLVMGENGARGQFGSVDPTLVLLTAGVIAGVVLGAVALNKIDKVNNNLDKITASP